MTLPVHVSVFFWGAVHGFPESLCKVAGGAKTAFLADFQDIHIAFSQQANSGPNPVLIQVIVRR